MTTKRDSWRKLGIDLAKEWTTDQYCAAYSDGHDCHEAMTPLIKRARALRALRRAEAKKRGAK